MSETLLRDIAEFCRRARMAESTFGRLAVNDGKLVSRLRLGGRVTTDTVDRVRAFIAREPQPRAERRAAVRAIPSRRSRPHGHRPELPLLRQPAEIPAVRHHLRREVGRSPNASAWNWPTSIRARRRCACSTPAWATARC